MTVFSVLYSNYRSIKIKLSFSLQAQMTNIKGADKQYRHNQQLEELRNLQDKLSGEKASWAAMKEQEEKELEEKRQELLRLQVCFIKLTI